MLSFYWFRLRAFMFAAVIVLTASTAVAEIRYALTALGTLGGTRSAAVGINNQGEVVGWSMTSAGGTDVFSASLTSPMTDLGIPGAAYAVNDGGQIVGAYTFNSQIGISHAFLLNPGGSLQDLGTLSDGSAAYAISNSGIVVGAFAAPNNVTNAFVYTPTGGVQTLGGLGGAATEALGVNNNGTIVGFSDITSGVSHAVTWNGGGPAQDLGITDQLDSIAHAINGTGVILGRYDTDTLDVAPDAFIFNGAPPPLDLGTFGGEYSLGLSINDSGEAVGDFLTTDGSYHAFLYDSTGGHDLNDSIDPSSGWTISTANGINNGGQIVGEGLNPQGLYEAYLLTPIPEPSAASLLVVGTLVIHARAIRRTRRW